MKAHFKHTISMLGLSTLALSFSANSLANTEVSYNITFASHYNWRGFDLSDGGPVLQGSVEVAKENGLYAGVWTSQYDFAGVEDGFEVDLYAGYSFDLADGFYVDMLINSYQYTGATESSIEWMVGLGHDYFALNYYQDLDLDTDYLELNVSYPLSDEVSANIHYGLNDDGVDRYSDYSVIVGYAFDEFGEISVGYSDHEFSMGEADEQLFFNFSANF